jgi:hypothetical protein
MHLEWMEKLNEFCGSRKKLSWTRVVLVLHLSIWILSYCLKLKFWVFNLWMKNNVPNRIILWIISYCIVSHSLVWDTESESNAVREWVGKCHDFTYFILDLYSLQLFFYVFSLIVNLKRCFFSLYSSVFINLSTIRLTIEEKTWENNWRI